jgi:signal transduction histidine kinase
LARTLLLSGVPAFGALVVICWWLLGREALKPLRRLVRVMRRAETGQASLLADEGRPDELGQAARSFDAMMAALSQSRARLEALYREHMSRAERFACVGELAANLAHEIKNPLAGLSGALELLADDLKCEPHPAEVVQEMRHQVVRLTRTMESLLSYARSPKARLRATDINSALERVLFLVQQQRRAKTSVVRVEFDPAPDLPPVLADPGQLEQVFLNLSLNACQAMNGHGGVLRIHSYRDGGDVIVRVADSGPGIPVDVRPHIFEPFFTTKPDGTGLGLAVSARVISEHGGTINFECPPEGGTIFAVTLRVSPTARVADAPDGPSVEVVQT